jgi:hypothetical protein
MPSRRPALQRSAPVTSVSPSANGNVVHLPLESFDIGAFQSAARIFSSQELAWNG